MAEGPVYSTRFVEVAAFTGEAAFLVPAGKIAVVRCIDFTVGISAGATVQAGLGGGAIFYAATFGVTAVTDWRGWRGRQILNPGEQLVLASDASASMMASGYLLTLP